MHELFRMKIAAKRQMTVPHRLLNVLGLSEGDEIQIEVADGQIVGTHACKAVPTALLSDELLSKIKKREAQLVEGKGLKLEQALPTPAEPAAANPELQRRRLDDLFRRERELVEASLNKLGKVRRGADWRKGSRSKTVPARYKETG
jgi:bifunctional DNA-binding transcriptional regulator/antitoxin component of YhaV-PrlF toxin-antitoxin module